MHIERRREEGRREREREGERERERERERGREGRRGSVSYLTALRHHYKGMQDSSESQIYSYSLRRHHCI